MQKQMICIECPKGCSLTAASDECGKLVVSGNDCPKGESYAIQEVTNPVRILTSTVRTKGLSVPMLPVRTDKAIPKSRLFEAMEEIKVIKINKIVVAGEVIRENFLGIIGINLIASRSINEKFRVPR